MRSKYETDSDALNSIYAKASTELARRYAMDDDQKSALLTIVLNAYFSKIENERLVGIKRLADAAVSAFDARMREG